LASKTHFRAGRHDNKENAFSTLVIEFLLLNQNQLLEIKNPKNSKIDFPYQPGLQEVVPARGFLT
jgi:hypothetical protein